MRSTLLSVAICCLGFAGGAEAQQAPKSEGSIREVGGKSLEQWIKEIGHKDPSRRETAIRSVLMFGPERAQIALPALSAELARHTPSAPVDVGVRVNAMIALGVILGAVKDADPKYQKDAIKQLRRFLTDSQAIVKFRAAEALGSIGPRARETLGDLIPLVRDTGTWETREAACTALGLIADDDDNSPPINVINALLTALGDPAASVRLSAIRSLTWVGAPPDASLRQSLLEKLQPVANKDADPAVQIWAHMALMSTAHVVPPEQVEPLVKMLSHNDVGVRAEAARALGTIGPKAKVGIPGLITSLSDRDPLVVGWSAWSLGRMGTDATQALPHLERIVADANTPENVKKSAGDAINQIKGKAPTK